MNQLELDVTPGKHIHAEPTKKPALFDTLDLSSLMLAKDEPICMDIILAHRKLAQKVVTSALDDLTSKNAIDQRMAVRFCLGEDKIDRDNRRLWLGWTEMAEDTLAKVAKMRLKWNDHKDADNKRQSRVLLNGEAIPIRRSRPTQPEGLSLRA